MMVSDATSLTVADTRSNFTSMMHDRMRRFEQMPISSIEGAATIAELAELAIQQEQLEASAEACHIPV